MPSSACCRAKECDKSGVVYCDLVVSTDLQALLVLQSVTVASGAGVDSETNVAFSAGCVDRKYSLVATFAHSTASSLRWRVVSKLGFHGALQ
jgi:hypothetical protein